MTPTGRKRGGDRIKHLLWRARLGGSVEDREESGKSCAQGDQLLSTREGRVGWTAVTEGGERGLGGRVSK